MKFKTNAKCAGCRSSILSAMQNKFPDMEWSMDLDNVDKVLECHGIPDDQERAQQILKTLEETGFRGSWLPSI